MIAGAGEVAVVGGADGRDRVVRHGHGPERTIQTGIGAVEVARVKIRDRGAACDGERIRFTSAILPLWARRTRSLDPQRRPSYRCAAQLSPPAPSSPVAIYRCRRW